ncbi:Holliday junction resolvase RecU [Tannockella kyphosi]|uniref:Holliday junction resolvase RecU n=1 Tax=Tannockella kyphosi TaxID=2899121 RepID=UPI0020122D79|nr:Holliday junction resolvase RecU [Tannockella kyphosi]
MVNYPNAKKNIASSKQSSSHRGMALEEELNLTNSYYLSIDKAVIYKKPTPVSIVKVDYPVRSSAKIVEAYYRTPSTTDYNGIYRAKYIDFEAKETRKMSFPFSNISIHQINHLSHIVKHGGIAFVIIAFTTLNEVYLVDASFIIDAYFKEQKHITYQTVQSCGHLISQGYNPRLDYLKVVDNIYF